MTFSQKLLSYQFALAGAAVATRLSTRAYRRRSRGYCHIRRDAFAEEFAEDYGRASRTLRQAQWQRDNAAGIFLAKTTKSKRDLTRRQSDCPMHAVCCGGSPGTSPKLMPALSSGGAPHAHL